MDDEYGKKDYNNTDFANQFRNMVHSQNLANQQNTNQPANANNNSQVVYPGNYVNGPTNNPYVNQNNTTQSAIKVSMDKNRLFLIVMPVVLALGAIIIVALTISYFSGEPDEEEFEGVNGPQDDAETYQDLEFNMEKDSEAPLLVYTAVEKGDVVDTAWLEEFRQFSGKYAEKYNKTAISSTAGFDAVTIQNAESLLFPNVPLKRFLISTSEGCARFDFYEDLLVVHDYELVSGDCSSAEFNFLGNEEN